MLVLVSLLAGHPPSPPRSDRVGSTESLDEVFGRLSQRLWSMRRRQSELRTNLETAAEHGTSARPASTDQRPDSRAAVRLVDDDGSQIGIKSTAEALSTRMRASTSSRSLRRIPVAKVMDYGSTAEQSRRRSRRASTSRIHVGRRSAEDPSPRLQHQEGPRRSLPNQRAKVGLVTIMFRGRDHHPSGATS
jgi:hypothetical protein